MCDLHSVFISILIIYLYALSNMCQLPLISKTPQTCKAHLKISNARTGGEGIFIRCLGTIRRTNKYLRLVSSAICQVDEAMRDNIQASFGAE